MHKTLSLLTALACIIAAQAACAADWYVDGARGDDDRNSGQSTGSAYKNPWKALMLARPGDTVHIMPTIVYSAANGFDHTPVNISHGGTTDKWLIIMGGDGSPAQRAQVVGTDNFAVQLYDKANWVQVVNLDAKIVNVQDKASWYGMYAFGVHHVTFRANAVHDSGGGGIGTNQSDYVKMDSNIVYNNAFNMNNYCGSGISLYEMRDSDTFTGLKNFVKNNTIYGNSNKPSTDNSNCKHSDGNGIIIDDTRNTQSNNKAYKSVTFVQSNLVVGNGGRGIDIFNSDLVTVSNNTLYRNMQDPIGSCWSCGEINVDKGGYINIYNNIALSNGVNRGAAFGTNAAISVKNANLTVTANNNLLWNDTGNKATAVYTRDNTGSVIIAPWGVMNIWADPQFLTPSLDVPKANFRVAPTSKARGLSNPTYAPPADMRQTPRSITAATAGSYE